MDELFALALIFFFLVLVLPVWAFSKARDAQRRITALEQRLNQIERGTIAGAAGLAEPGQAPERPAPAVTPQADERPQAATRAPEFPPEFQGPPAPRAPSSGERLGLWLRENWIYPAAAGFLLMAGVFLVQYSIERGLLSPQLRVAFALILGAALMAAGEVIRRRAGLSQAFGAFAANLPSTFAGAGVVVIFAAIYAAHVLYALVPAAPAFGAMALVAAVAVGLGWVYGPLLAALGVVAGTITPFLLGEGGTPPGWIFGYFAILIALGLGIDAFRRWRWVSVLALVVPLGAATLMRLGGGDATAFALLLVFAAALAMTLPTGALRPMLTGPGVLAARQKASVAVLISAGMVVAATGLLAVLVPGWGGALGLVALITLLAIWARPAPALADQVVLPALGLLGWTVLQALFHGEVLRVFNRALPPESAMPLEASFLLAFAVIAALAMLWRSDREDAPAAAMWAMGGVALPGAVMVAAELFWSPAQVIGPYPWALHALGLAALNTGLALRFARVDGGQGLRLGSAASAAFGLVAFGLMLVLSASALSLALAALMIAAAAMDRRFNLPMLGWFLVLSSMALAWRLVVDPGLLWILDGSVNGTPLAEVVLTLIAVLGGPAGALWLLRDLPDDRLRRWSGLFVETGLAGMIAVAVPVVLLRLLPFEPGAHAMLGLHATAFVALAWVQARRAALLNDAKLLRRLLAGFYGLLALGAMGLAITLFNPLFSEPGFLTDAVAGPPVVNDLLVAYAFPALLLLGLFWQQRWVRVAAAALLAFWAFSAIRHLWQGSSGFSLNNSMLQGELYTYTVAILLAGAAALAQALRSGLPGWRKLGMGLVALATIKAFAVDASGLDGLLRVFGFLAMGLALAGLAWVNRWVMAKESGALAKEPPSP